MTYPRRLVGGKVGKPERIEAKGLILVKIAVIGSGYVGTVTGTCLAEMGHTVICADLNEQRMKNLQSGSIHFYEEGLEPLIASGLKNKRLQFTTDVAMAVRESEIVFLCIGTPALPNGKPDMNALTVAAKNIAGAMDGYRLIIEKTTMPIKTGEWLAQLLRKELKQDVEFDIAAVPQFLREGKAVYDFMHPDRIIVGAESQKAIDTIMTIYGPLGAPVLVTDINSAEVIKHAANAFLAMKISFINSISQLCEKTGADVTLVTKGLGMDKRISPDFLNAGIGYGGIFFQKDISNLLNIAEEYHVNLDLLKNVEIVNRYQRITFIEKIDASLKHRLEGKTVAVWGLAYRPFTDDMRDAPSITVIRGLEQRGAKIHACDPLKSTGKPFRHAKLFTDPYEAAKGADVIAILTEWDEFKNIDFERLKKETDCRIIVDGRNLFDPEKLAELGFTYISIGRKPASPKRATAEAGKKG